MTTKDVVLTDKVEVFYEKKVTSFGTSAKVDAPKKYIGKRAYVIILKDWLWNFVPMPYDPKNLNIKSAYSVTLIW